MKARWSVVLFMALAITGVLILAAVADDVEKTPKSSSLSSRHHAEAGEQLEANEIDYDPKVGPGGETWEQALKAKLLTIVIIAFGLIVFVFQTVVLYKSRDEIISEQMLTISTVTLVIIGGLLLITAGFSSQQISPVVGLFGSILGYVLGKRHVLVTQAPQQQPNTATDQGGER